MNSRTGSQLKRGFSKLVRTGFIAGMIIVLASWASTQMNDNAHRKTSLSQYAALQAAPETARARQNPFQGNPREGAAGGKLFEQHCADCHGKKAGGTRHGPSLLREEVRQATPGQIFWVMTNGVVRHGMPVWSKLPEPERWQIVTFLESLNANSAKPATLGESANR
jgi:mono/diheme cytochrome c family protein